MLKMEGRLLCGVVFLAVVGMVNGMARGATIDLSVDFWDTAGNALTDTTGDGIPDVDFAQQFKGYIWAQAATPIATAYFDVNYNSDLINATSVDLESILNFFPETGTFSAGDISLVGGGNVSGFSGGAKVKIGTINFTSLSKVGTADISLVFTTDDECALVGGGALLEGEIGFGSTQVSVLPEPASLCLLALGGTVALRRRKLRS